MAKKIDPFGDTIFIRMEISYLDGGYNIAYSELDRLKGYIHNINENPKIEEGKFLELELLSGSRIFIRTRNISDFSISTPESRKYNIEIEETIEANEKEKEKEW